MKNEADVGHQITARKIMELVIYDNGCIRGLEPDNIKKYPKYHFDIITKACELFFDEHPEFLTDEDLEQISTGDYNISQEKYGMYLEYKILDDTIYNWFQTI